MFWMVKFLKIKIKNSNQTKYYIRSIIVLILFCCCEDSKLDNDISEYGVVINEINYNSSDNFNPDDWVEIYNNSDYNIDLSLWVLKDENDDNIFTIPSKTIILPDQYIVFCKDTVKFIENFPNVEFYYGDLGFGFSGGSDLIRLFDSSGALADTVRYDDDYPWPVTPDGNGPTLELKNPSLDNSQSSNWSPSQGYGTPGTVNSIFIENE